MEKYREKMESANLAKNFRDPDFDKDEKMLAEIDVEVGKNMVSMPKNICFQKVKYRNPLCSSLQTSKL